MRRWRRYIRGEPFGDRGDIGTLVAGAVRDGSEDRVRDARVGGGGARVRTAAPGSTANSARIAGGGILAGGEDDLGEGGGGRGEEQWRFLRGG
jgi:hypothetical protein